MEGNSYANNYNRGILQRTEKRKAKQKFQTGETKLTIEEKKNQIVQIDIEFADDTQLLIEKTHTNKCVKA